MREHFDRLAGALCAKLRGDEQLLLELHAEDSDFVRFNRARVRQSGRVRQQQLGLRLVCAGRQAEARFDLSLGAGDLALARRHLARLREYCGHLPPDPYLNLNAEPADSESVQDDTGPPAAAMAADIAAAAVDLDLVGILAAGRIWRGFANSLGQRNWHQRARYDLDFSLYAGEDRAVKSSLAGSDWQAGHWRRHLDGLRPQLQALQRPRRALSPGAYRAYLAPAALLELFGLLSWGGFGRKALETAQTPLLALAESRVRLDPRVGLREDRAQGMAPAFGGGGHPLPPAVDLIVEGRYADNLVDERSAAEYGARVNAAVEAPETLVMSPGDIDADDLLAALDTGLFVNNLWYCNYADRNRCRVTGMTRFATFWVEDGELRAPAEVMRFDDSLYRMLGSGLLGLTRQTELLVDAGTYGGRALRCARLPGALVDVMQFPL